jgi:hypothetical protein
LFPVDGFLLGDFFEGAAKTFAEDFGEGEEEVSADRRVLFEEGEESFLFEDTDGAVFKGDYISGTRGAAEEGDFTKDVTGIECSEGGAMSLFEGRDLHATFFDEVHDMIGIAVVNDVLVSREAIDFCLVEEFLLFGWREVLEQRGTRVFGVELSHPITPLTLLTP